MRFSDRAIASLLAGVVILFCAVPVWADPIPMSSGLYNTGVDGSGQLLADQTIDQHYLLTTAPPVVTPTGNSYTYASIAPVQAAYGDAWAHNTLSSQWIGPTPDLSLPTSPNWDGDYYYNLTFDLAGFQPGTAVISGGWVTDNGAEISLNGGPVLFTKADNGYHTFTSFTISSGFIPGLNTLTFKVNNATSPSGTYNPTGLQVNNLTGSAIATPEPAAIVSLGCIVLALAGGIGFQRLTTRTVG